MGIHLWVRFHYEWSYDEPFLHVRLNRSSNKMPVAVKDAIRHAVEKEGGKTVDEAREFVAAMERDQKMIEECWS
jgi:hypothetical protein